MFAFRVLSLATAALAFASTTARADIDINCEVSGGPGGIRAAITYTGVTAANVSKVTVDYYEWDGGGYNTHIDGSTYNNTKPNEQFTDVIAPGNVNFNKFVKDRRYRCVVTIWGKPKPPATVGMEICSIAFDFVMQ